MKHFIRIELFCGPINHLLGGNCCIGHPLAPTQYLFVNLSVSGETQFLNHSIAAESDRVRNLPCFDAFFAHDLEQGDEFISVSRRRQTELLRATKLCCHLNLMPVPGDDLLYPAGGAMLIPSIVCAEKPNLQEILLKPYKININRDWH